MAIKLTRMRGDTRSVRLDFGDDGDLNVTFTPGGITPAREEELAVEDAQGRGGRAVVSLLCEIVTEWDLLDDDGNPYPLDVDVLMRSVPGFVFFKIFDAIKAVTVPGEASAAT